MCNACVCNVCQLTMVQSTVGNDDLDGVVPGLVVYNYVEAWKVNSFRIFSHSQVALFNSEGKVSVVQGWVLNSVFNMGLGA